MKQVAMFSNALWLGGLAVFIAAGIVGASVFGPIQDKLLENKLVAYDKTHGTTIHTEYLIEDRSAFFEDYCAIDRKKLAAVAQEETVVLANVRTRSRNEARAYVVLIPVIILVIYLLIVAYFRRKRVKLAHTKSIV